MPIKDPEKRKVVARAYYAANIEKKRAQAAAWRAANREKKNTGQRAWAAANQKYMTEWRNKNPSKNKEYKAKSDALRPGVREQQNKAWRLANPEKVREQKKRHIGECRDGYVRLLLCRSADLLPKDIPQPLVDLKRICLKIGRKCREDSRKATESIG